MDLRLALRIAGAVFAASAIVFGTLAFPRALRWRRTRENRGLVDNATANYLGWMFFFLGSSRVLSTILSQDLEDRAWSGISAILVFSASVLTQMQRNRNSKAGPDRPEPDANSTLPSLTQ